MLEKIDVKNIYSANKLKGVNRQNGNLQQRRFNQQLKEEEKKEKNRQDKTDELVDYDKKITDESILEKKNNIKTLNEKKEKDNAQGVMIDIRI